MKQLTRAIGRPVWAAAVALTLIGGNAALAADPSPASVATAKQLLTVTKATNALTPLIPGIVEQSRLLYLQQNPALGKDLNEIATKMRADLQPRFSELIDTMAKMYAGAFTDQEMKDIITFYESPAGKKLVLEQPKLVDSSMSAAGEWANKVSEEVTAKMREELIKRGHKF